MGGLGNLLFQIATAYALSKEVNNDFAIDVNKGEFPQKHPSYYSDNLFRNIKKVDFNSCKFSTIYTEPFFSYKKIPLMSNIIIKGYFQSEKYFEKYYEKIYNLFIDNNLLSNLKDNFNLENSLSMHIRRGDYVNKPNYHANQPIDYYLNSIKYIDLRKKIDRIYVFSDDIEWCKKSFSDDRIIYVENLKDYEELHLMSLCENNIIANSSFSWWGSYLNRNEDKIVIAPKIWFGKDFVGDWQDIYYKNNIIL